MRLINSGRLICPGITIRANHTGAVVQSPAFKTVAHSIWVRAMPVSAAQIWAWESLRSSKRHGRYKRIKHRKFAGDHIPLSPKVEHCTRTAQNKFQAARSVRASHLLREVWPVGR